ncbi:hypothetical protein C1886_09225 [Pseudomonas sp. FW300-N1A1]|nr:hypothetical protein C1886_09225 [Pseudomonas sp. FW300-N1A1]
MASSPEGLLWRGSLLPLGGEAVVKPANTAYLAKQGCRNEGAAAQPSGSKLPRHRVRVLTLSYFKN